MIEILASDGNRTPTLTWLQVDNLSKPQGGSVSSLFVFSSSFSYTWWKIQHWNLLPLASPLHKSWYFSSYFCKFYQNFWSSALLTTKVFQTLQLRLIPNSMSTILFLFFTITFACPSLLLTNFLPLTLYWLLLYRRSDISPLKQFKVI